MTVAGDQRRSQSAATKNVSSTANDLSDCRLQWRGEDNFCARVSFEGSRLQKLPQRRLSGAWTFTLVAGNRRDESGTLAARGIQIAHCPPRDFCPRKHLEWTRIPAIVTGCE